MTGGAGPLVVLDDDPTGTQAVAGVPVLLEWSPELVRAAAARGPKAIHLLTNARALPAERARAIVEDAAAAAVAALGRPRLALRGDSTLRAHLLGEYLAVGEAAFERRTPPLLLVPALPAAGRVTVGGIHLIERDGRRVPLHETEYARDPSFAYTSSRLLEWAEERSGGFFRAADGLEVAPDGVGEALKELAGRRAVCVPDAETIGDLERIAAGLHDAEEAAIEVVVRSAPTFVGVLSGALARERPETPQARRLLVVCGSYVPQTTRQLAELTRAHPGTLVEVDASALASPHPAAEIERAAEEVRAVLARGPLAVVATPRKRLEMSLEAGGRVAEALARVVPAVEPDVVLAKGGVTSAVTAKVGLRAASADVLGPLVDGVALWRVGNTPYVVFPGNVGDERALLDVVDAILSA
jgi:uncharacterized protein YgbK (DUF1537 family)